MKKNLIFIITIALLCLPFAATAATCTKEAVKAADQRWAQAIASNSPEEVAKQYAKEAIILATLKGQPLHTQKERYQYFQRLFQKISQLHVRFDTNYIQVFHDTAISTGFYTFIGIKEGEQDMIHARYTFVYESTPAGCELIYHHSSLRPEED